MWSVVVLVRTAEDHVLEPVQSLHLGKLVEVGLVLVAGVSH